LIPNAHLLLLLPVIGSLLFMLIDAVTIVLDRKDLAKFPGGIDRLVWAVLLYGLGRGIIFGLFFVPSLYAVLLFNNQFDIDIAGLAFLMLAVLFIIGLFIGWVERQVAIQLDSSLLKDRKTFFAPKTQVTKKKAREGSR
jgi:hypothetical protein